MSACEVATRRAAQALSSDPMREVLLQHPIQARVLDGCRRPPRCPNDAGLHGQLLAMRICRVLIIAHCRGYGELVLGAWGCGAFQDDQHRTATDFRTVIERDFARVFSEIVFAGVD